MMRRSGLLDPSIPAGPHDHASWGYRSRDERGEVVRAWLGAGLSAGYRALYVNDAEPEELFAEVASVPGAREAARRGALVFMPTRAAYDLRSPINPAAQLAVYAGAVEQSLADGYKGLRVAADITPLVADPSRLASHLAWEQFADTYISTHPLAPLCLYDAQQTEGVEPIACVHALQGPDEPRLSVFAVGEGRSVQGELDGFVAASMRDILEALPDEQPVLDLRGVRFVDARGAWTLNDGLMRLRDSGRVLHVQGASRQLREVWRLCGFDSSLIEAAA